MKTEVRAYVSPQARAEQNHWCVYRSCGNNHSSAFDRDAPLTSECRADSRRPTIPNDDVIRVSFEYELAALLHLRVIWRGVARRVLEHEICSLSTL